VLLEAGVGTPEVILIASGSELGMAVEARAELEGEGIGTRVVSMPSWRLFADQSAEYRDEVLPPRVEARVSMEAGSVQGWSRWVGPSGMSIGIDHFGASAPAEVLFEQFGITATRMTDAARSILGRVATPD
jgi:transketolase